MKCGARGGAGARLWSQGWWDLTSLPRLSSLLLAVSAGVVIAVCPHDPALINFCVPGWGKDSWTPSRGDSTNSTWCRCLQSDSHKEERWTINTSENAPGTLRALLCAQGVPLVLWSCATSHKCFPTVPAPSKACLTPPSGTAWVSLGHAENRFLFGMLVWTRGWWKGKRIN